MAAEHTWVNAELARFYDLDPVGGAEHVKVSLPAIRRRGLLGQASIHTLTANGVETSPVIRGVWLLETLFGTPPQPPPPDVPPLEPDIRGATTIREQLAKHANVRACNDCHRKIDPLGFAMEHFDPIGRYRERYSSGQPIDSSGQYRDHKVSSVDDIRDFLVEHPELLAHNVAHRYLTFALGRSLEFQDRGQLNHLIGEWEDLGYGLGDLAYLIVESEPFQSP